MNVAELIEKLKDMPQDCEVFCKCGNEINSIDYSEECDPPIVLFD